MDTTRSLRLLVAAGSILIALVRLVPADVVATTLDPFSLTTAGGSLVSGDEHRSFYHP
jgi:hypothetical protein